LTRSLGAEGLPLRTSIAWVEGRIRFIDQRLLPGQLNIIETDDWQQVADAIDTLALRGAPLIGVAAALAVAATAMKTGADGVRDGVISAIDGLAATRPTAANLFRALERMQRVVDRTVDDSDLEQMLVDEALGVLDDDRRLCSAIGRHGNKLIPDTARILTVCNTGFLATAGEGTALAAVYRARDAGKKVQVFVCETRPLLQGARLTAWELTEAGIPVTLMVDSAAAGLIAEGGVDLCLIGADRIAANGDVVNKVGSYQLALACKHHDLPFYVAAPGTTVDTACSDGSVIPVEERSAEEVAYWAGQRVAPTGVSVWNPAFDHVPADLVTGIITEEGVIHPPYIFES